ncbi:MAG: arginine--tRNA ligase [Caldisericia bacterium]|nr:arginine--tRNA ligase [Caldisericia bacterium]
MILRHLFQEKFSKFNLEGRDFNLNLPKNKNYGDISTDFLINLKDKFIREEIKKEFERDKFFKKVEIIEPGFLNLFFSEDFYIFFIKRILKDEVNYLKNSFKSDKKIQIEFVSANPTGPLTLGNGRNAVIGDVLANTFSYLGINVYREYYVNDAGKKVELLVDSVISRMKEIIGEETTFPEDGYRGEYVIQIAKNLIENGKIYLLNDRKKLREEILSIIIDWIKRDLLDFGVYFDNFFSEKEMRDRGEVEEVLKFLKDKDMSYEKDGAIWFKSTLYGDEKDRVLVKSDGEYTYFLTDIAYHINKWRRGFDEVIDIWGWDHIGHIEPLKNALTLFGIPKDFLKVILYQIVHLKSGGKEIKMSKTSGEFVLLRELIDEIGKDTVRFIFLSRASESPLDFDIEIAKKRNMENPVYYIQYAYTRAKSIEKKRIEKGVEINIENLDLSFSDIEREILNRLIYTEEILYQVINKYAPHLLPFHSLEISKGFHTFYHDFPVLSEKNEKIRNRRYLIVKGVEIILNILLNLMGVSTPEEM